MNIHEYQAKQILRDYKIAVPDGSVVSSVTEAVDKAEKLGGNVIIKAQIHAGGRGKAGGIKLANSTSDVRSISEKILGKKLVTQQTGPKGQKVSKIYIEKVFTIEKEYYLSCLVDRKNSCISFVCSEEGGVNIEEVAKNYPKKIYVHKINPLDGLKEMDTEKISTFLKFKEGIKEECKQIIAGLYKLLIERDASLIEINPLVLTGEKHLVCLDAKMNFDDNALFRQEKISSLRDLTEEDSTEIQANKHGLSYIKLEGDIGCMVNGAGLAMATMDIIKLYGAQPANFLDVGGGASTEKVSVAFQIILSDKNVKSILINIFGGIMRCDVLAQGVVNAAKEINLNIPLIIRLAGTNVELGKKILKNSSLPILPANNLAEAAEFAVKSTKR
jgi:succinyl-CoA synthetase beta subunit